MDRTQEHLDEIAASARGPWNPHAFDCANCPGSGCPAWWVEKWYRAGDDGVLETRVTEGCGFRLAQGMFVRALAGTHHVEAIVEQKTKDIEDRQIKHGRAIGNALQKILIAAAKNSGNPIAAQAAPMIPKIVAAAKKLLTGKRKDDAK